MAAISWCRPAGLVASIPAARSRALLLRVMRLPSRRGEAPERSEGQRLLHLVSRRAAGVGITGVVGVPDAAPPGLSTGRGDVEVGASLELEDRLRDVARYAGVPEVADNAAILERDIDCNPPIVIGEVLGIGARRRRAGAERERGLRAVIDRRRVADTGHFAP